MSYFKHNAYDDMDSEPEEEQFQEQKKRPNKKNKQQAVKIKTSGIDIYVSKDDMNWTKTPIDYVAIVNSLNELDNFILAKKWKYAHGYDLKQGVIWNYKDQRRSTHPATLEYKSTNNKKCV